METSNTIFHYRMDKDTGNKKDAPKNTKEVDVGGIMIQVGDGGEISSPSAKDIENELREGGIEVVDGRKSPDGDLPMS